MSCTAAAGAEPVLEKTNLFEAGKDGYTLYRIPGIVATPPGTLMAYCEARKGSGDDWSAIDILMRRSTDGGKTWEQPRKLVDPGDRVPKNPVALRQKSGKEGDVTVNNPVAIIDRKSGIVHFLYCIEYARCYWMHSEDDGKTFSQPIDITGTFEKFQPEYAWKVLATGPGHGIQLHNGRLVVPVWLSTGTVGHGHRPSSVSVIYSDDHGRTWNRGEIVAADPKPLNPSETVVVQLQDGRVLFNIRHEAEPHRRAISISPNGATGWSPLRYDDQLPEPICMASIIRYSEQPAQSKNRILFANPHNPDNRQRKNLTIKLSYDEAKTWPVAKTLEPGVSGYSDLAAGPDGTIYCFYERGSVDTNHFKTKYLCLARFNLAWLTDGKDEGRE
jgi:sialidase-1